MSPQLAGRCHGAPKTSMPRRKPTSRQPAAVQRTLWSLNQEGSRSGFTAERYLIDGREEVTTASRALPRCDGLSLWVLLRRSASDHVYGCQESASMRESSVGKRATRGRDHHQRPPE